MMLKWGRRFLVLLFIVAVMVGAVSDSIRAAYLWTAIACAGIVLNGLALAESIRDSQYAASRPTSRILKGLAGAHVHRDIVRTAVQVVNALLGLTVLARRVGEIGPALAGILLVAGFITVALLTVYAALVDYRVRRDILRITPKERPNNHVGGSS